MSITTNALNRAGLCLSVSAALLLAGCHGNRSYSFSGGAGGENSDDGTGGGTGGGGAGGENPGGGIGGGLANVLDPLDPLGRVTVGDTALLNGGPDGSGPLAVNVGNADPATGDAATLGVLSGGQVLAVNTPNGSTTTAPAGTDASGLLGVGVGDRQVLGADGTPLIDLNVLSPNGAQGTLIGGNVLSNGQPAGVAVGGVTSVTGGTGTGATGTVGGVVGGVLRPLVRPR